MTATPVEPDPDVEPDIRPSTEPELEPIEPDERPTDPVGPQDAPLSWDRLSRRA